MLKSDSSSYLRPFNVSSFFVILFLPRVSKISWTYIEIKKYDVNRLTGIQMTELFNHYYFELPQTSFLVKEVSDIARDSMDDTILSQIYKIKKRFKGNQTEIFKF